MRGPPPFATLYNGPQAARRWRGLPGARGAARSRPRVALVCAALGPPRRNARRGCPNPPRYAKKCRTAGVSVPPGPGGPRVPLPPLAAFSPAGLSAAIPSRLGCWWWSWAVLASLPRRRGPLHENAGGGRGSPAPGLLLPRAFSPLGFFLPPPAFSLAGRLFPLRLGCLLPFLLSAWRPAVGGPRRPCGRQWYTEGAEDGENERRPERPRRGNHPTAFSLCRALPASLTKGKPPAAYRAIPIISPFYWTFTLDFLPVMW